MAKGDLGSKTISGVREQDIETPPLGSEGDMRPPRARSERAAGDDLQAIGTQDVGFRLAASIIEGTSEGVLIANAKRRILSVNPAFTALTGFSPEDVIGRSPATVLRSKLNQTGLHRQIWRTLARTGRWQGEIWGRRKDGKESLQRLAIDLIRSDGGSILYYVGLFAALPDQEQMEQRLYRLTWHDALTDLPNRQLFLERLDAAIATAVRDGRLVALLHLDLDRFKEVNKFLGHGFGDHVLSKVGSLLAGLLGSGDTVARIGADEFTIILRDVKEPVKAIRLARRILQTMDARPFVHAGHELFVTASIGVALFPTDAQEADGLLRCAATAMHRAKESGRNGCCAYAAEMAASLDDRLSMEVDLRRAVDRDELYLEYQPRVGLSDFRVVGCEALLRWNCVRRGRVSPARFIPLAEETGLIVPIGHWVIEQALRQAQQWRGELASLMRVGVNVSGIQLRPSHAESLFSRLLESDLPDYRAIELELTESVLMDEPERINATLSRARGLGIEIAIDDFGTGYSSLSYLKSFPIDRLKIDASFVRHVEHDPSDAAIARAVIAIGHALGLKVVAEGVETPGQLAFLLAEGCDEAQGFLFSRPLSAADMAMIIANERPLWKTGDP